MLRGVEGGNREEPLIKHVEMRNLQESEKRKKKNIWRTTGRVGKFANRPTSSPSTNKKSIYMRHEVQ